MSGDLKERLGDALHDARLIEMNMRLAYKNNLTHAELLDLTKAQAMGIVKNLEIIVESEILK